MFGKKRKKRKSDSIEIHTSFDIEGQQLPVIIFKERRNNARIYVGKKAIRIRLPIFLSATQEKEQLESFKKWVAKKIKEREGIVNHYEYKQYYDGQQIVVGQRTYQLAVSIRDNKRNSVRIREGNIIDLRLSKWITGEERWKDVRSLMSRAIAHDFRPAVEARVHELNALHFQKPINKIFFKNNFSNSGSCSINNNINLTTSLFFAPPEVMDYIIIHELAHLIERNHSLRFWALVARAMPEYKEHEAWLKQYGRKYSF
jgi:predicted metal-dependent hydrolase